jgi:hypothetical protein
MTRSVPPRTSVVAKVCLRVLDGRVVVEAGGRGDAGDDVVRAADAESMAALVEEQRRMILRAGPVGALGEPASERRV